MRVLHNRNYTYTYETHTDDDPQKGDTGGLDPTGGLTVYSIQYTVQYTKPCSFDPPACSCSDPGTVDRAHNYIRTDKRVRSALSALDFIS